MRAIDKRTALAKWIEERANEGTEPDIPEWLQAEALVPVGDTEALAARWLALLRDDTRAAAWGAENAERIARDGDRRVQMDAMDALYRRLLREPAR